MQTYQRLQEVERQEMIHEAEDEEVQLDQESMDQNSQVQELIESTLKMKEKQRKPMNELDAVTVQIEELSQIRVIAEKLKELRQARDKEKQLFDQEVEKLTQIREEINGEKQKMKAMYR